MARLDSAIERLFSSKGEKLVLESGAGILLKSPNGTTLVVRQKLTSEQLIGAFMEIIPTDIKLTFPEEGTSNFPYVSRAGAVQIKFEKDGEQVSAIITPYAAPASKTAGQPNPSPASIDTEQIEPSTPKPMSVSITVTATW